MRTIQLQAIMLDEKVLCRDCARWKLLTDEERDSIGVPEFISVGLCHFIEKNYEHQHMSEDVEECIFDKQFTPIIEQTCYTCSDERCKEHGKINQGCVKWTHQLARFRL